MVAPYQGDDRVGGGLAWGVFGDDPARAAAVMSGLTFLYAAHISQAVRERTSRIQQELEFLKGSARMNRYTFLRHTTREDD